MFNIQQLLLYIQLFSCSVICKRFNNKKAPFKGGVSCEGFINRSFGGMEDEQLIDDGGQQVLSPVLMDHFIILFSSVSLLLIKLNKKHLGPFKLPFSPLKIGDILSALIHVGKSLFFFFFLQENTTSSVISLQIIS